MSIIAAHIFRNIQNIQLIDYLCAEKIHLFEDRCQVVDRRRSRYPGYERQVHAFNLAPIAARAFFDRCRDELTGIASANGERLFGPAKQCAFCRHLLGHLRKLLRSGKKRGKIEPERILDVASPVLPDITLPICTVFANNQPSVNKRRQVPPQRGAGDTVRTDRQLSIRRKDDERVSLAQIGLRIEAQERVKNGKCTIL
ncbi:hypothetical protein D9M72_504460 [compost metagenome]